MNLIDDYVEMLTTCEDLRIARSKVDRNIRGRSRGRSSANEQLLELDAMYI